MPEWMRKALLICGYEQKDIDRADSLYIPGHHYLMDHTSTADPVFEVALDEMVDSVADLHKLHDAGLLDCVSGCFGCNKPVHLAKNGTWACSEPNCQFASPLELKIERLENDLQDELERNQKHSKGMDAMVEARDKTINSLAKECDNYKKVYNDACSLFDTEMYHMLDGELLPAIEQLQTDNVQLRSHLDEIRDELIHIHTKAIFVGNHMQAKRIDAILGKLEAEPETEIKGSALPSLQAAYRKHCLNDESIGWDELGSMLCDALCEIMGDDEYQKWIKEVKNE